MVAWLTSKLIAVIMAVLLLICLPASLYFGLRWEGLYVPFVHWTIIPGGKQAAADRDLAIKRLKVCQDNEGTLNAAIDDQNFRIKKMQADAKVASDAATKRANDALAAEQAKRTALEKRLAHIQALGFDRSGIAGAVLSFQDLMLKGFAQ